jgi:hypothetical protein
MVFYYSRQFPVQLAVAMTINKAQSVTRMGVDLWMLAFASGLLVGNIMAERMVLFPPDAHGKDTTDVVYRDILLR